MDSFDEDDAFEMFDKKNELKGGINDKIGGNIEDAIEEIRGEITEKEYTNNMIIELK